MGILQVVVTLQTGCDELRVVNQAVLIGVDDKHGIHNLGLGELDLRNVLETVAELFWSE